MHIHTTHYLSFTLPLSSVLDAHVADHIFNRGILTNLIGQGKTVVLVTHQVHLLDRCDTIFVMDEGVIKAKGNISQLRSMGIDINYLSNLSNINADDCDNSTMTCFGDNISSAREKGNKTKHMSKAVEENSLMKTDKPSSTLMTAEERVEGIVEADVYVYFISVGGPLLFCVVLLITIGSVALQCYASFYLSDWGKDTTIRMLTARYCAKTGYCNIKEFTSDENVSFLNMYALFMMLYLVGTTIRTAFMVTIGINSSRYLHRNLLRRILAAPVAFFDSTPMGRILNRFSADITQIDEKLGYTIGWVVGLLLALLGVVGSISYSTNGLFLVVIPPLFFIYYRIQLFFRRTNTELKRLENISRSPIYTEFQETLQGVSSLRAFGEEATVIKKLQYRIDQNSIAMILQLIVAWWLNIRLDLISACTSFFVAALAAGAPSFIPLQYLGLALQQSFQLTSQMKMLLSQAAIVEAMMSSVERIQHYSENVDVEEALMLTEPSTVNKPQVIPNADVELAEQKVENYKHLVFASPSVLEARFSACSPPDNWPDKGCIEFRNVSMCYRDGPLVLNNFTASLNATEKVGIAGRTGSGKSSLMVALFRIAPLASGSIFIDGIDTSTVPLSVLRSRIGIIPQDPVIFSATIRYNLDPLSLHTDDALWSVLEMVSMKDTIISLPLQLLDIVSESGDSLSLGQRQLLNIARVLLRKPKILVMDEATASIDNDTDELIQNMVRERFRGCTVLTIAHRLNTIIEADRIMVLEKGQLSEFDTPRALTNSRGLFASLWAQHQSNRDH